MEVVGEAARRGGGGASGRPAPDVILMDLVMPGSTASRAMRVLREPAPSSRVIVLTSFLDDARLLPAIESGAAGYLLKDVEPAELARAVRRASRRPASTHGRRPPASPPAGEKGHQRPHRARAPRS